MPESNRVTVQFRLLSMGEKGQIVIVAWLSVDAYPVHVLSW